MKPFRFKLQAVLTLRQREEQAALEKYAQALLTQERAMQNLSVTEHRLSETWAALHQALARGVAVSTVAKTDAYGRALEQLKDRCQTALSAAQRAVNLALRELIAARQQREAAEKYLKNQRRRYDREFQREEQKILDELSARRLTPALDWRAAGQPITSDL